MDDMRRRLSYSNVMATLAVFISLGGTSYAALELTGREIRDGSLTAKDLKRETLGGKRVKESTLGRVPRAANADRLNGVPGTRFLVRCPTATVPVSDVCVETQPREPEPYRFAAVECEGTDRRRGLGRRLPSHDELMTAIGDYDIALAPNGELTRNVYPAAEAGRLDVLVMTDAGGDVGVVKETPDGARAFRCVADPLN